MYWKKEVLNSRALEILLLVFEIVRLLILIGLWLRLRNLVDFLLRNAPEITSYSWKIYEHLDIGIAL